MKIYLAGVCSSSYDARDLYHLESFFNYSKTKEFSSLEVGKGLLIDSGAFSFMNAKSTKVGKVNLDYYVDAYIDFLKVQKTDYYFELDVDSIKGLNYVEQVRRKLESKVGKPCIPVWHKSRGIEYFKGLCRDYQYIAIGGLVSKEIKRSEYSKLIPLVKYAHSNNCKIHGLGFTAPSWLRRIHWDSVDSTSWSGSTRFGRVYTFKEAEGNITYIDAPYIGKRIKAEERKDISKRNFREWVKFQKFADRNL